MKTLSSYAKQTLIFLLCILQGLLPTVSAHAEGESTNINVSATQRDNPDVRCVYCHDNDGELTSCEKDGTSYHADCFKDHGSKCTGCVPYSIVPRPVENQTNEVIAHTTVGESRRYNIQLPAEFLRFSDFVDKKAPKMYSSLWVMLCASFAFLPFILLVFGGQLPDEIITPVLCISVGLGGVGAIRMMALVVKHEARKYDKAVELEQKLNQEQIDKYYFDILKNASFLEYLEEDYHLIDEPGKLMLLGLFSYWLSKIKTETTETKEVFIKIVSIRGNFLAQLNEKQFSLLPLQQQIEWISTLVVVGETLEIDYLTKKLLEQNPNLKNHALYKVWKKALKKNSQEKAFLQRKKILEKCDAFLKQASNLSPG